MNHMFATMLNTMITFSALLKKFYIPGLLLPAEICLLKSS